MSELPKIDRVAEKANGLESAADFLPGWHFVGRAGFWVGLLVAGLGALSGARGWRLLGGEPGLDQIAGMACLMAIWWLTEAVPVSVTALVPLALVPLFGVLSAEQVAAQYGRPTVFLFLGGFLLALAVERTGLQRRIALNVLNVLGTSPARLALGFMLATVGISMWASNTATTLLMLPIAQSVAQHLAAEQASRSGKVTAAKLGTPLGALLVLCVAYGASLGGLGTPIGTPVNAQFLAALEQKVKAGALTHSLSFAQWMLVGVPLALGLAAVAWGWLVLAFGRGIKTSPATQNDLKGLLEGLGPPRKEELRVAALFGLTAVLWIFRMPFPNWGWATMLPVPNSIDDGTVAMAMATLAFFIPGGSAGSRLLDESVWSRVRWDVLLLFGGGMALAAAMEATGLNALLARQFVNGVRGMPQWLLILAVVALVTFLGELASNVAIVNLVLPLFFEVAVQLGMQPLLLLLPVAFASSCGFALPVATPPNALAYATGEVSLRQMAFAGLVLDVLCILGVTGAGLWLVPLVAGG